MVIIGSSLCNPTGRPVGDIDWLCTRQEWKDYLKFRLENEARITKLQWLEDKAVAFINGLHEEACFIDSPSAMRQSDKELHNLLQNPEQAVEDVAYLLKYSHRFKKDSAHFEKTRADLFAFEKKYPGIRERVLGSPTLFPILQRRELATYTNQLPKLNQTKTQFFTDSVPYKYDHDSIHEAVKHLEKPAYQFYMAEGAQVLCSKAKWDALPEQTKLFGVLEESYVLAIERAIVPFSTEPHKAFKKALEKVCTSITSGWFREFAWENYYTVLSMYDEGFVLKFMVAQLKGEIKPYRGGY